MLHRYASYSDESCINDDYTIIGGVVCKDGVAKEFRRVIEGAQGRMPDAMKWSRIRAANFHRYERLVQTFFDYCTEHLIDFHAVVVDANRADHASFNEGDKELGFNKFVVQHLHAFKKKLGPSARIRHVYAHRTSPHDLNEFSTFLNIMARKHYRRDCPTCLGVDHVPYRKEPMLWIADILIGAIGASYNRNGSISGAKMDIAESIRQRSMVRSLREPTPLDKRHFKIWEIELRPPRA